MGENSHAPSHLAHMCAPGQKTPLFAETSKKPPTRRTRRIRRRKTDGERTETEKTMTTRSFNKIQVSSKRRRRRRRENDDDDDDDRVCLPHVFFPPYTFFPPFLPLYPRIQNLYSSLNPSLPSSYPILDPYIFFPPYNLKDRGGLSINIASHNLISN